MKELFADANAGITGLILFFLLFIAMTAWTMRPSARSEHEENSQIPLREDK